MSDETNIDDTDREDETVDVEIFEGEPEFSSSSTEDDSPEGYQDDGDLDA